MQFESAGSAPRVGHDEEVLRLGRPKIEPLAEEL